MNELHILRDLIVITGITIPVILLCHRLRIPSIVGFLLAGVIAGPHGFSLVTTYDNILIFAEFGVIALLFTIGLEFSLKKIWQIRTIFFFGGALQVLLTCLITTLLALLFRLSLSQAIFTGFVVSLSSTALALSILQEQAKIDSPQGRISLAILIFQDIAVVAMILFLPLLSGKVTAVSEQLITLTIKLCLVGFSVFAGVKWIVPWILYRVVKTGNRELFLIAILFLCLSVGYVTSSIGLSLALGAFLAGLIMSESDYSHRAMGSILPLKDIFTSFFFVSIGMLFDIGYFMHRPLLILLCALAILFLKAVIGGFTVLSLRWPLSTALLVGASISQVGEFSFILIQSGANMHIIDEEYRQIFLGVTVCTLFLTPLALWLAPAFTGLLLTLPLPRRLKGIFPEGEHPQEEVILSDHLIVVGYGLVGKNLARAAKAAQIHYTIIELNPDTVEEERKRGEQIYYGDGAQEAILHHVHIDTARVMAIAISDPAAIRRVIELARRLNPDVYIIVRTRFMSEIEELVTLGANDVIPEEFETSVEIFTRVLRHYLIPAEDIEKFTVQARADGYRMFRAFSLEAQSLTDLLLSHPDVMIMPLKICSDSPLVEKTIAEADLRKKYNISVLVVQRGSEIFPNPSGEVKLNERDIITVMGTQVEITAFKKMNSLKRMALSNGTK